MLPLFAMTYEPANVVGLKTGALIANPNKTDITQFNNCGDNK